MFWGYGPALDLLRELERSQNKDVEEVQSETTAHAGVRGGSGEEPDKTRTETTSVSNDGGPDRNMETGDGQYVQNENPEESHRDSAEESGGESRGDVRLGEDSPGECIETNGRGRTPGDTKGDSERDSKADSRRDAWKNRQNSKDTFDIFRGLPEGIDSSPGLVSEDSINILLVGSGDARHIFKSISRLHRHERAPVRFYVVDPLTEMVGRQLLLTYAILQPPTRLGLKEKVRLLMEIAGNTLIRPATASWIGKAAKELQKMVTNQVYLHQKMPQVRVDKLRYQERDQLEDILSFWQGRPQNFRIGYHWDERLRKYFKSRYDNRSNLFDWDYYMALKDLPGGDRICMREYKNWRSSGVAFTWLEAEPSIPNVTLATGIFREGRNLLHHGYLGDIRLSPYIAYSTEVEAEDEKDMWVKRNEGYVLRSTDVSERHLSRIAYEMVHQQPYIPPAETATSINGVVITQVTDLSHVNPEAPKDDEEDPTRRRRHDAEATGSRDSDEPASCPADAQVIFLSAKLLRDAGSLRRLFDGKLDVAVVASVLAEAHVHADLLGAMRSGGLLLVEGSRFHLLRKAELEESAAKLVEKITGVGFHAEGKFEAFNDNYARFRARR